MIFFNSKFWLPVWTGSKGQLGSLFCKYFLTINDLYNGAKILNLLLAVAEIWFFKDIQLWLPVWIGNEGQFGGHFLVNIIWQLTICTMVQKLGMYLLWSLRYDCFNIKLWLPVWTGSKGQLGHWAHLFVNIFLRINNLYNSAKIVNLPFAVVEIWFL